MNVTLLIHDTNNIGERRGDDDDEGQFTYTGVEGWKSRRVEGRIEGRG